MAAGVELGHLRRRCSRWPRNLDQRGEIKDTCSALVLQCCEGTCHDVGLVTLSMAQHFSFRTQYQFKWAHT
jgi:hypothetical protein